MRWFKIHVSATLIILAGWCAYDAVARDEPGWAVAMALIVMLNIPHLKDAIYDEH